MREAQPGVAGRQAAERGSYWGWTLAAVFLSSSPRPPLPGILKDETGVESRSTRLFHRRALTAAGRSK